jgi:signal transduction histidine kinase
MAPGPLRWLLGGARRAARAAGVRRPGASERVARLAEANALLTSLHEVAKGLPSSLDLDEVLDSTMRRLCSFLAADVVALMLPDEGGHRWLVVRQEGVALAPVLTDADLPPALAAAVRARRVVTREDQPPSARRGLSPSARSGLYAPLVLRGGVVGVVAVERHRPDGYDRHDADVLEGFTEAVALAVDNARWFARLRTAGADEERVRLARDLHDRVGQTLAGLGFEIDRLAARAPDEELRSDLARLRAEVSRAVGEVGEVLHDLRRDVDDAGGMAATLEGFLARVRERRGVDVRLVDRSTGRLPPGPERELWRIAQEAVVNAERHAGAGLISVHWSCDGHDAELEVVDDGRGFDPDAADGRADGGLRAMRRRAEAIGADLTVDTRPSGGTRVQCCLGGARG